MAQCDSDAGTSVRSSLILSHSFVFLCLSKLPGFVILRDELFCRIEELAACGFCVLIPGWQATQASVGEEKKTLREGCFNWRPIVYHELHEIASSCLRRS